MLKVNAKKFLAIDYDEVMISTSGLYAAPGNDQNTRQKLFETLQAFFKQEQADSFFALSLMATMSEVVVAPLGVIDIEAVKQFDTNANLDFDHLQDTDQLQWPLAVKYIPHTKDENPEQTLVSSPLELKSDFAATFEQVWAVVAKYLAKNQATMTATLAKLIADSDQIETDFMQGLQELSDDQRQEKVGFDLPKTEIGQFSNYMSDSHEVMNIVRSAADFVKSELVRAQPFAQVFNDARYRTTYYWVLDNTFYQTLYYYIQKYTPKHEKLAKFLKHREEQLLHQMRQSALNYSQKMAEEPKANVSPDVAALFDRIFLPINEKIIAAILDFGIK
ncbi:hypothetical protein FHQ08_02875 [Lactobacillus sp. CC-MHH1034]|uniref:hypothetical protein n=1 Tax=Agrilactobacillus fermenti TaxID=2586909 RepID=UPI001E446331|nr:hypothetical protein [Agrilactobacillus fermenti]MCD2255657.1 hypothetical protein [Agrilactobacillus fermenti]